jgi:hypothetical protein
MTWAKVNGNESTTSHAATSCFSDNSDALGTTSSPAANETLTASAASVA